ncbi:MAG: T9SS type A sorting domain-containing protein [Saprospiraceae bacterium]|nr:T9SS type A sorting domain-containing protein [Saprospiraceae bacterium]
MKIFIPFILLFIGAMSSSFASPCITSITFTTQAEIDAFPVNYPGCTEIETYVNIGPSNDITNLDGLSQIRSIGQGLNIYSNNSLRYLDGLNNLEYVGPGSISVYENPILERISGFNGTLNSQTNIIVYDNPLLLQIDAFNNFPEAGLLSFSRNMELIEINGFTSLIKSADLQFDTNPHLEYYSGFRNLTESNGFYFNNTGIIDFNSFNSITKLGYLIVYFCDSLINFNGLNHLPKIGKDFDIAYNTNLSSLSGLSNLNQVGRNFNIGLCPLVSNFSGLESLTSVGGDFVIGSMDGVNSLIGLEALSTVGKYFVISYCPILTNLNPLANLNSTGGLQINYCHSLLSFSGLENLKSIDGNVYLDQNDLIVNFQGFQGLTEITGDFAVYYHPKLQTFNGLQSLTSLGGNIFILWNNELQSLLGLDNISSGTIDFIGIEFNPKLSYCSVSSVCNFLRQNGFADIEYNLLGCNSNQEVSDLCGGDVDGDGYTTGDGDCDDFNNQVHPGIIEICNGLDDNCNGSIDEGFDPDLDGIASCFDNCSSTYNPQQLDSDCDGVGDACDECPGGNDLIDNNHDGKPDCKYPPGYKNLLDAWKCGAPNLQKCYVSIKTPSGGYQTVCTNYAAATAHIKKGGFIGPYGNANCNGQGALMSAKSGELKYDEYIPDLEDLSTNLELTIHPNPVYDHFKIDLSQPISNARIHILDVMGNQVWSSQLVGESSTILLESKDLDNLKMGGLYIIKVDKDQLSYITKFILVKN